MEKTTKVVAHVFLLGTSYFCMRKGARGLKYAKTSFQLYFILGGVTLLNCVYDNPHLARLEEVCWVWAYVFGIPLLACDLSILSPYVPDISPLHLVIPIYTILSFHAVPEKVDSLLLAISHTISILFLATNTICDGNISGFVLSFIHFFTMFRLDPGVDSRVNWAFFMGVSNVLALNVITTYF